MLQGQEVALVFERLKPLLVVLQLLILLLQRRRTEGVEEVLWLQLTQDDLLVHSGLLFIIHGGEAGRLQGVFSGSLVVG